MVQRVTNAGAAKRTELGGWKVPLETVKVWMDGHQAQPIGMRNREKQGFGPWISMASRVPFKLRDSPAKTLSEIAEITQRKASHWAPFLVLMLE